VADKKAESIVIMDLRGISDLTDFYVLANGMSEPHLRAIRDDVEKFLYEQHQVKPLRVQGEITSGWIILDYVDVVIHLFSRDKRENYGLETLWNDATIEHWEETPAQ
jgi:ribosome-associated protein